MKQQLLSPVTLFAILVFITFTSCCDNCRKNGSPVGYVNPYMGNISHLLVPTYPTVHLPFGMLRIYPNRPDFTSDQITGLPVAVTNHRGGAALSISPLSGTESPVQAVVRYTYDKETVRPYRYSVYLDEEKVQVDFAPSYQSGLYSFSFEKDNTNRLIINTRNGQLDKNEKGVSGYQTIGNAGKANVYVFFETDQTPLSIEKLNPSTGRSETCILTFNAKQINLRYGISFISSEQAEKNLRREINGYNVDEIAKAGRDRWNEVLSKIEVKGADDNQKAVFYTSLYRTYERMIGISEDGSYYSAFDQQVHSDEGQPFYTDDWIWDTYRAVHPLRVLIEADKEVNMIQSYIRMAQQSPNGWLPTFPGVAGDSHAMNGNHGVAMVWDAYCKGLRGFDLAAAYAACKSSLTEKSLIPWRSVANTELDVFYHEKGYFPALKPGEKETIPEVHNFEKRQPIAVTLGTCYDFWCLSQIAKELGKNDDYRYFLKGSYNFRNVYNPETAFFHPKDVDGNFIQPFDYTFSGGQGAREYYDENNGWVYRWDIPHNPAELIRLMGSPEIFAGHLDQTFRQPLGKSKYDFYYQLPDHTGNVGQFSMANEPSLHIPYLYNYAGQPWKTQKRIRNLLKQWFRNDLMGVPGDEDGGGLSAFVVFSAMGFYPVTPGSPTYNIGSPVFNHIKIRLSNGKIFEIEAKNASDHNKYIQSAVLNGVEWNKPWFNHSDLINGGKLVLVMGDKANRNWGTQSPPPSAEVVASGD